MDELARRARETHILAVALGAAGALGLTAELVQHEPRLADGYADALVRIGRGDQTVLYTAEVVRTLWPATLGAVLVKLERLGPQALLVTDQVTPALADELKARRIPFLDTAGNAYLDQPNLYIWVKGQKAPTRPAKPEIGRAFQPTGLQVLFALLCDPRAINRPYRDLAAMAGVAHGTVGWVIPDLQRLGFAADLKGKRGTRRLFNLEMLLDQWVTAYARVLRPRLLIGRYYIPTIEGWKDWPIAEYDATWGGEPAGALLTNYLRPGELTLYAEKLPGALAGRQRFNRDPGVGHNAAIDVRKRFWNFPGDPAHPTITPPILVYADLLATGDARCIETAKMVYDAYVTRLFKQD
jgi:hypothetical protein